MKTRMTMRILTAACCMAMLAGCASYHFYGQDPDTPRIVILAFREVVEARDWDKAEECLSKGLRAALEDELKDRTFFDQYLVAELGTHELIPVRSVNDSVMKGPVNLDFEDKPIDFVVKVNVGEASGVSAVPAAHLVREHDGWKLVCPKVRTADDFLLWYDTNVPEEARGEADKQER